MRKINKAIIHCAATVEGSDFDVDDIRRWHKARGWSDVGYHYVILLDGTIQDGRPLKRIGAHAKGYNRSSIGICYIGGVNSKHEPKDTRTACQKEALVSLLSWLKLQYEDIEIFGHNEISNKACPSFDARKEYEKI